MIKKINNKNKKKILVTGNLGYIGSVLTEKLKKKFNVIGCDIGYFKKCTITKNKNKISIKKNEIQQIYKNINNLNFTNLKGVNTIIHLAALSNDPLGELKKNLTNQTNNIGTIKLAKLAKKSGVKRFIFISTQSIYGISNSNKELTEDAKKNPITSYAKTKFMAEKTLKKMANDDFEILIFRPATVFGPSPRFRSDIVVNNFVGSSIVYNTIEIHSNGKPWRPILYIDDLCKIIKKSINIDISGINGHSFNVGPKNGNFTVRQLANIVSKILKSKVIFSKNPKLDQRTYKISFKKLYRVFGENIIDVKNFKNQIKILKNYLKKNKFNEFDFTSYKTNRILQLKKILNDI